MEFKETLEKIRELGYPLIAEELEEVIETRNKTEVQKLTELAVNMLDICYDLMQIIDFSGGNE